MVVAGHAGGGAAPRRLGHAEIGALGEQEFHHRVAAQPGTVDERVLDQVAGVEHRPARSHALSAAGTAGAGSPAVLEVVPDPWYVTRGGGEYEVVHPGAAVSERIHAASSDLACFLRLVTFGRSGKGPATDTAVSFRWLPTPVTIRPKED